MRQQAHSPSAAIRRRIGAARRPDHGSSTPRKAAAHRLLPEIVRYLLDGGTPTADLVDQVTEVGRDALQRAVKDPVFIEALWCSFACRRPPPPVRCPDGLAALGLRASGQHHSRICWSHSITALERVQRRSDRRGDGPGRNRSAVREERTRRNAPTTPPGSLAAHRRRPAALPGVTAKPRGVCDLAQRFHSRFVDRVIHYFIDRNLHRMIGPERVTKSLNDVESFDGAVRRHCDESSLIMRSYARDCWARISTVTGRR